MTIPIETGLIRSRSAVLVQSVCINPASHGGLACRRGDGRSGADPLLHVVSLS
jgi:hypothetical protein